MTWLMECYSCVRRSARFSYYRRGSLKRLQWPMGSWSPPWPSCGPVAFDWTLERGLVVPEISQSFRNASLIYHSMLFWRFYAEFFGLYCLVYCLGFFKMRSVLKQVYTERYVCTISLLAEHGGTKGSATNINPKVESGLGYRKNLIIWMDQSLSVSTCSLVFLYDLWAEPSWVIPLTCWAPQGFLFKDWGLEQEEINPTFQSPNHMLTHTTLPLYRILYQKIPNGKSMFFPITSFSTDRNSRWGLPMRICVFSLCLQGLI